MAITLEKIRNFPIFSGLEEQTLRELAFAVAEQSLQAGQIVFFQGEEARYVYIVARGIIRVRRLSPEGKDIVLHYLGPGRVVDPASAVDGGPYTVTADALTKATVYALPPGTFRQLVERDRHLASNLLRELAGRTRHLTNMVEEMALHTVRARLARFLLQQAELKDQYRPWTQAEIASQIGTVREIVGRVLRDFASKGLITRQGGHIVILNREKLREIALMEGSEEVQGYGSRGP